MSKPKRRSCIAGGQTPASEGTLVKYTSLAAYFHESLEEARCNQRLEATDASEFYVVSLLESFTDADILFGLDEDGQRRDDALAMILHRAVFDARGSAIEHYRRLGDVALYIAGFFADSLRRRAVGLSYYVDMGQGAYATLANSLTRAHNALREIFAELAQAFAGWVEVLREVSETSGLATPVGIQPVEGVFERWRLAPFPRSEQLARELFVRGLMPAKRVLAA